MATLTRTAEGVQGVNSSSRLLVRLVQWGVALLLVALVLFPTWPIIYQSFLTKQLYESPNVLTANNYPRVLSNPEIWQVLTNTAIFMVGSTIIGTIAGIALAVLLTRTDMPGRSLFSGIIAVPYYISALILAFAWAVMYGPQGFVTVLVRNMGLPTWNLYSMGGLIVVSAVYFMPLTYLYCSSSLRLADPQLEAAARIGGAKPMRVLMSITIPLMRPAMLYSALLTLVSGIELLSIPLVLGEPNNIDVLSTFLFRTARLSGTSDYGTLAVVAILSVVFVTALVALQNQLTKQERRFVSVGGKVSRARLLSLGALRWPAAILVGLFVLLAIVVPLAGITLQAFAQFLSPLVNPFSLLTMDNFAQAFQLESYRIAILNSLFVATVGGFLGTIFMAMCALLAYRSTFRPRGIVKYLALYPRAFPGTVIGIGFLWAFLVTPGVGWLLNTAWVLVIAYSMRYLPLGFSSISPSILQISDELDRAARVGGANWLTVVRRILLPLLRPALVATFILLFITYFKEYAVALFLNTSGSQVIGTKMIEEWEQGGPGPVAALAVVQLVIIGIVVWVSGRFLHVKLRD
ncbi:MAG TPA: iron ABC transporter permease [Chloroflexia bacterium]|nr:iron ABC transporter permease [Chloroflexia bacterium]